MTLEAIGAALLTVAAGWIGYRLKTSYEERRHSNEALFELLNLWSSVRLVLRLDFTKYIDLFFEKIFTPGALKVSEQEQHQFKDFMLSLLRSVLAHRTPQGNSEKLQRAIAKLSIVQPVLAHDLRSNEGLANLVTILDQYFQQLSQVSGSATTETRTALSKLRQSIVVEFESELLNGFERDLKRLAWRIDPFCWFEVRRTLASRAKRKELSEEEIVKEVEEKMRPMLDAVLSTFPTPPAS